MNNPYRTKILLVEDSVVTRRMEVGMLNQVGYTDIIEVNNGEEAKQALQKETDIDLVISDWNMPSMNGYELLKWVRTESARKNLPFIMVTSRIEKHQPDETQNYTINGFITKPFDAEELKSVIGMTLGTENIEESDNVSCEKKERIAPSGKPIINVAHIQITDHLVLGVAKHMLSFETPKHFELETCCLSSWNQVQSAIEKGDVDGAFILAPIAMDLFASDIDIRLLLFAHKNGSICVRKKNDLNQKMLQESFKGTTFYIPHLLSIQHMLSDMFLREIGLKPGLVGKEGADVFFEVVPPVMMPAFMKKSGNASGFMVAEPVGTNMISKGDGNILYLSGQIWENHPCCVFVARNDFIEAHGDVVQEFVDLLVKAGDFISGNLSKASKIAVDFLDPEQQHGLSVPVVERVLQMDHGLKTDDLYPVSEDLDLIQKYMCEKMEIGSMIDLDRFVDTRFADKAYASPNRTVRRSVFHGASKLIDNIG